MLDASLEVRLLMLKPHPLKQRFLVLFQVLTAPEPPVTNYWKSVTFKTQNHTKKNPQIHRKKSKNITQKSYHRQLPTRKTNNKIKKMKRKPNHPPPFPPYRTHCNQHKAEKPISHAIQPKLALTYIVPARHSTQRSHTRKMYDPARQRNSHGHRTPKVNKTRNKCNN
jgi:hypothetical protein